MMPALIAATRCPVLSVCFVLFVWCVCVIAVSVLSTAPLRRLQRLPRRWERTPWCRCIRWKMQLAACVRVHCACARVVGMFVDSILSDVLTGGSSTKYLACVFLVLTFCMYWSILSQG